MVMGLIILTISQGDTWEESNDPSPPFPDTEQIKTSILDFCLERNELRKNTVHSVNSV